VAPLIVITGPTASGKTGLALELAERYNGEIICADSRTIYGGMDIGTAKPTAEQQARVPHHLLDVVKPGEKYSAADFQRDAYRAITNIRSRGKVPFLVGGTGLYIDAVVREYQWPARASFGKFLEEKTLEELQAMIKNQHKPLPENALNKRHLISVLERENGGTALEQPHDSTYVVAIATEKDVLRTRIEARARAMFAQGVIAETKVLSERYGWDNEAMTSNIYPIVRRVIDNEITLEQAIDLFAIKDWRLAKRQLTWLKRYEFIKWFSLAEARAYIETILG
jgi:tRNA dimethylallyltransferase